MWMKQLLFSLLGMTLIWSMAPLASSQTSHVSMQSPVHVATPPVIRFRVIANSDNPIDQAVKLDVRDEILATLEPQLNGVKSRRVAAERIAALKGRLSQVANQVLTAHQVSYRARVKWTKTQFPTKAYGSWVLPAGTYQALLIVLGKGAGHNWWCVLFPSLCFIDMGNALAVPASTPASPVTPSVVPPPIIHHQTHSKGGSARRPLGHIRVSWTSPRFFTTFLAILRK